MKYMKTLALLAVILMAGSALAAEKLVIDGSTTVGPIGDAFAEAFKDKCDITVSKTGSGDGAKSSGSGQL